MGRWWQAIRVAGYPTRYELECASFEHRSPPRVQRILGEYGIEARIRSWGPAPVLPPRPSALDH